MGVAALTSHPPNIPHPPPSQIRVALLRATAVSGFSGILPRLRLSTTQALFLLYPFLMPPWAAARKDMVHQLATVPSSGHLCLRQLMTQVRESLSLPDWVMVVTAAAPNPFRDVLPQCVAQAEPSGGGGGGGGTAAAGPGGVGIAGSLAPLPAGSAAASGGGGGGGSGPKHGAWRWHLD